MNFELNFAQAALKKDVRGFTEKKYRFGDRSALLQEGLDAQESNWTAFAQRGWLGAAIPRNYGGLGGDASETAVIAHEFGRALVVEPYMGCAVMAPQTLLAVASASQLALVMPDVVAGKSKIALAYSEPQTRGMPEPIFLRAERVPDGYRIYGFKTLVLGGAVADRFIVSAVAVDQPVLLLVDAVSPGLNIHAVELHDGSHAAQLNFEGVFVPTEQLLAIDNAALDGLRLGLAHGTIALCAELVGVMERAIEITAEYIRTRVQFGRPIGQFQTLKHRIADMATEMELARSMLFALMVAVDGEDKSTIQRLVSQAKSLVCRSAKNICGQAIQMHGGIGMTEAYPIGHYFKRAVVADIILGSSDSHNGLRAQELESTLKTAELRWYELLPVWWSAQNEAFTG
ncbi:acyl-CoA dehydrogenase family protein [Sphingobium fluviale]|uniref:Acyl-CoA dehydrogenase n=1 Tax=Sphingobium fluviale TaxID=2506423 RepID=A0A4Q1KJ07_9SPHN|nr:acyl-CoA dehydrogenase family protein [Sphingobium fluviale]RXR29325.1 acyl-CoA dehydrogenase [Sphingobium fluviale]